MRRLCRSSLRVYKLGGGCRVERAFCDNWSVCHNANLWQIPQNRKMTFSRSSFVVGWFCCLAFGWTGVARPLQSAALQLVPRQPTPERAESAPARPNQGELLLRRSRAALARHKTIRAKLHQRIRLYGQEMVGAGIFVQGPLERNLLQLDLNIKVAGQDSYLQQRCDGRYYWLQKFVEGVPVLTRVDVKRVEAARAALAAHGETISGVNANHPGGGGSLPMLSFGGIAYLIDQLNAWCIFAKVFEGRLPGTNQSPVLVLEGTWRPQRLLVWLPEQKAAVEKGAPIDLGKLPAMIPDRIVVSLGRDDLFPRRIEYRVSEGRPGAKAEQGPLVQLHFEDVQFDQPADPRQFQFGSSVVSPIDDTDGYLLRQGLISPTASQ
jgi:hypothetical protein